jgi:hypothetical protein
VNNQFVEKVPNLLCTSQDPGLGDICHVDEDIIGGMAIQRRTQTFPIEVVTDEANTASENKQTIERANLNVLVSFFGCVCATVPEEINEAKSNANTNIQN